MDYDPTPTNLYYLLLVSMLASGPIMMGVNAAMEKNNKPSSPLSHVCSVTSKDQFHPEISTNNVNSTEKKLSRKKIFTMGSFELYQRVNRR